MKSRTGADSVRKGSLPAYTSKKCDFRAAEAIVGARVRGGPAGDRFRQPDALGPRGGRGEVRGRAVGEGAVPDGVRSSIPTVVPPEPLVARCRSHRTRDSRVPCADDTAVPAGVHQWAHRTSGSQNGRPGVCSHGDVKNQPFMRTKHPAISRAWRTWMALAICPARQGQQRSLRRMSQVLSWALARSPGARSFA